MVTFLFPDYSLMKPIKNKMKKLFLTLVIALNSLIAFTQTSQYVNGYYRSNGTYVQGYYRTKANNTIRDNYSTKGNINPYTGKSGTKTYYNYNSYKSRHNTDKWLVKTSESFYG